MAASARAATSGSRHAVALAGCETVVDPATGQSQTRWTLPLTSANADAADARWRQCVQFRSESFCERDLGSARPPGIPPVSQAGSAGPENVGF